MDVRVDRWAFTIDDYHKLAETGILAEDDRVELIEGEVVKMSPIGKRHAACVKRLNAVLAQRIDASVLLSIQDPIMLDDYSEPEPDVALLKSREDFYGRSLPVPDDVLLLIEVSETSVEYDRRVKLPLYARAGIVETWLVVPSEDHIEVYSEPVDGIYQQVVIAERGELLSPRQVPQITIAVDEVLG